MVRPSLSALALLALTASVAAFPAASTTSTENFTFSSWIEGIIADPNAEHLSPEEAVAAKNAVEASAYPLRERAWCRDDLPTANANDAAECLSDLARKGNAGQNCVVPENTFVIEMCHIGNAKIIASKSDRQAQGANCNDVARTAGLIFDSCWRADNTIKGSEICVGNNRFQVNISGN